MTLSVLDQPAARTYRETAERFRTIVRNSPQQSVAKFLRDVDGALADLYSAGSMLPELEPDTDELPESNLPADRNQQLQGSLAQLLGQFDSYREIFDPTDPADKEPVQYRVSLDLIEILDDQDYALSLLDRDRVITPADVVWQWRFGFTSHWGRHVASVLRVINSLLYTQFIEALEEGGADA